MTDLHTLTTLFGPDAIRAAALYEQGAAGVEKWETAVNDVLSGDIEAFGGSLDTALIKTDLHTRISAALDREQAQIPRSRTNHTDFCYYCAQSRADRRRVKADRRVLVRHSVNGWDMCNHCDTPNPCDDLLDLADRVDVKHMKHHVTYDDDGLATDEPWSLSQYLSADGVTGMSADMIEESVLSWLSEYDDAGCDISDAITELSE